MSIRVTDTLPTPTEFPSTLSNGYSAISSGVLNLQYYRAYKASSLRFCRRLGAATDSVSCSSRNMFTDTLSNRPTARCPDVSLQGTPRNGPSQFFWSRGGLVDFGRLTHICCLRLLEFARSEPTVVRAEVGQRVWSVQCRIHQDQNNQAGAKSLLWEAWNFSPRYSVWDRAVSVGKIYVKALEEIGQGAVEWLVCVH